MPTPYEQEDDFDAMIKQLAGPSVEDDPYAEDAAIEKALTMELGLNDAPERSPEAQRIIDESRGIVEGRRDGYGGRSPEAQRLIDQAKSIVGGKTSTFSEDPAAEFGALADPAPEPAADPYASAKGKGYGPETAEQMAAPEAPIYTPKGPGQFRDAMSEGSDKQGRLGGVDPRFRQADEAVSRLNTIRAGMQPPAQRRGPGQAEQSYRSEMRAQDEKAKKAYLLNWLAGGPQQAMQFQQAYEQKRKAYLDGLKEARGQDIATARESQPISDAQAQTLVRVYGVTPEAAAKMTVREYAQLEPVLKSAPYAVNQQDSLRNKYSVEELRTLLGLSKNQNDNASDFGTAQLRGQNALATVKANKKGGGGGGGGMGQPKDIVPVLAAQTKMTYDQANLAYQRMLSGVPAETPEQEEAMTAARILEQMPSDEFKKARVAASNQGVLGRTNTANRVDESIRGKQLDPGKRSAARVAFTNSMSQLGAAKRGFDLLSKTGKIGLIVKVPYGEWDNFIATELTGPEQDAARAISAFVNPTMRKQTGAAMSVFEKQLSFTQFGITDKFSPGASPDALGGFLRQARDELMNVHDAVTREYGANALPKIKGR